MLAQSKGRKRRREPSTPPPGTIDEAFHDIVAKMMFSSGDGENPKTENVELVVDLMKNEVISLLNAAAKISLERLETVVVGDVKIKVIDVISVLKHQTGVLIRLYNSAKTQENLHKLKSNNVYLSGDENDEDFLAEYRESPSTSAQSDSKMTGDQRFSTQLKGLLHGIGIDKAQIRTYHDDWETRRQQNVVEFVNALTPDEYERFSKARRTSVHCTIGLKTKSRRHPSLRRWLGRPPLGINVDFILAHIARETVNLVVGSAVDCRRQMGELMDASRPLQNVHYEEAIRRNKEFRKNKKFFFK